MSSKVSFWNIILDSLQATPSKKIFQQLFLFHNNVYYPFCPFCPFYLCPLNSLIIATTYSEFLEILTASSIPASYFFIIYKQTQQFFFDIMNFFFFFFPLVKLHSYDKKSIMFQFLVYKVETQKGINYD